MFTSKDKEQILQHGISLEKAEAQMQNFAKGFPFACLHAAATAGNGIVQLNDSQLNELINKFETLAPGKKIVKFVPASGMASRMFKDLIGFCEACSGDTAQLEVLQKDKKYQSAFSFIENIQHFAFYDDLKRCLADSGLSIENLITGKEYHTIIDFLLNRRGLDYAFLPKGLLKFHRYGMVSRTAIEEHLTEGANYIRNASGEVHIHFTLSPEHIQLFEDLISTVLPGYEEKYNAKFLITHSLQSPSTDTLAADENNEPFREADGSLIFRKGGHGALLKNLGELDTDIVFIKNIDNIVPDHLKPETYKYKKALGGMLIDLQNKVFHYLRQLENNGQDQDLLAKIEDFCTKELSIRLPAGYHDLDILQKAAFLSASLNRPIRICGMVKNVGEPGGGPYWVRNSKDEISLQIVESSQVDMNDPEQDKIFKTATHFNPVDLVCSLKNHRGEKFHLQQFVDPETGLISIKTHGGKQLKAQELPGLWNGAMAGWITVFVETPLITFNPVKTVEDLLRPEHQHIQPHC